MKLQNIALEHGDYRTRHRTGATPISYLFVETVVESGLLKEAVNRRFGQLMRTAIAQLQNFMTPGASSDLSALLGFINPAGGGVPRLKQMVQKAKDSQKPVLDDQTWWQDMFEIFGVKDEAMKTNIIANTKKSAGAVPGTKAPQAQAAQTPAQQAPAAAAPESPVAAFQQRLAVHKEKLMARQGAAAPQPPAAPGAPTAGDGWEVVEGIWDALADSLLAEASVKSSLRFVASNMIRKLGYASTTNVPEEDWLKDFLARRPRQVNEGFSDFFRELRAKAANPGYADVRANNAQLSAYNERAAKLAVRFLSDYLTAEMQNRLKVANLSPDDMMRVSKEWQGMQMAYQKNQSAGSDPAFMSRYQDTFQKLQRLLYALNPDLARQSGGAGGME